MDHIFNRSSLGTVRYVDQKELAPQTNYNIACIVYLCILLRACVRTCAMDDCAWTLPKLSTFHSCVTDNGRKLDSFDAHDIYLETNRLRDWWSLGLFHFWVLLRRCMRLRFFRDARDKGKGNRRTILFNVNKSLFYDTFWEQYFNGLYVSIVLLMASEVIEQLKTIPPTEQISNVLDEQEKMYFYFLTS